jgi:hypothetical protein
MRCHVEGSFPQGERQRSVSGCIVAALGKGTTSCGVRLKYNGVKARHLLKEDQYTGE